MQFGRLTQKALALGAGRAAAVLAQFVINLVLVRWWTPEEFGRFHQVRVIISLAALFDLGLPVGLLQATSGMRDDERDRLFHRGISFSVALGVIVGCGFVAASFLIHDGEMARALPAAGLLIAATIPAAALESVLVVRERHLRASVAGAGAAVGGLVASALVLYRHPSLAAVYLCLALAAVARLFVLWAWGSPLRVALPRLGDMWPLLRTSFAVSANRLLAMASSAVDRAVVALLFSAATLGWYVTGAWELPFVSVLFGAITSAILPEMSQHWAAGRREDFLAVWQEAIRRTAWVIFPIWLWAWVWAPELLRVLFTPRYEEGLPVFRVYLLVLPLRVAIYSVLFLAMNETRLLLWGAVLDLVLNLCLSLGLATLIGPLGPAVATVGVTWIQAAFYLVAAGRVLRRSALRLLPWDGLARAVALASVAVVPTLAIRPWVTGDLASLAASIAAAIAIWGAVMPRLARRQATTRAPRAAG